MASYIQISKISLQSIVEDKIIANYIQISKISLQISLVVKLDITRPWLALCC
jgi:propanediol dehydratase small subunit